MKFSSVLMENENQIASLQIKSISNILSKDLMNILKNTGICCRFLCSILSGSVFEFLKRKTSVLRVCCLSNLWFFFSLW